MDLRETVAEAVKSLRVRAGNSPWYSKWIWWILGASLGLFAIAFLVLETMNKSKKAAKALHQRDVLIEKQTQAEVDAVIATSEKERKALVLKADKHVEKAEKALEKNKVLTERAEKNKVIINSLRSMDDVRKKVRW